jgi:Spy/CpxP family protein refolding chaperone
MGITLKEANMRKTVLALAALAIASLALPYAAPAKADTVVIHKNHHWWHPHHDNTVVIKRDHDRW